MEFEDFIGEHISELEDRLSESERFSYESLGEEAAMWNKISDHISDAIDALNKALKLI